jgi:hypothetical protein
MSILDAYIPEGTLSPSTDRELLAKITDLLLEHEGVDPSNESARPLAWVSAGVDTGRLGCPEGDPCRTK